jgi:hypothetical protein
LRNLKSPVQIWVGAPNLNLKDNKFEWSYSIMHLVLKAKVKNHEATTSPNALESVYDSGFFRGKTAFQMIEYHEVSALAHEIKALHWPSHGVACEAHLQAEKAWRNVVGACQEPNSPSKLDKWREKVEVARRATEIANVASAKATDY